MKRALTLSLLLALGACGPKAPPAPPVEAPVLDPEAWRAQPPGPSAERAWTAPVAQKLALSNGIPVLFVQQGDLPLLTVQVVIHAGLSANPPGKAGLSGLTANLLDEGTKRRDGATLAADASGLGATLSTWSEMDKMVVEVNALTGDTLAPTLDMLAEVVLSPRFDKADFTRVQSQVLTGILSARSDPRTVGRLAFARNLYGADHPYGLPLSGTEASVKGIKLKDVQDFYAQRAHAGNATLVVTGAISPDALLPLLEARFGGWKALANTRSKVEIPTAPEKTRLVFIEQPGAVQSVIRLGSFTPSRHDDAYWPANLAVYLYGGMFSSRLNMNLREEKGWSYGASAGTVGMKDHGTFSASSSVQADQTAPAVLEMIKEMTDQAARVPTDAEMARVRDSLVKALPGTFESNATTAGVFADSFSLGLPLDTWASYPAAVNGVSAQQVAEASKAVLNPEHLLVVVVGPRQADAEEGKVDVVEALKGLGFAFEEQPAP